MSTAVQERAVAAPGTRSLLLQLEPTPYILPRALYVYKDPELHTDLFWTFVNSSQNWGSDAEVGDFPVLLDQRVSLPARLFRVAKLMWSILRGRYTVAHLAGWGHWVVRLAILCCKIRGVPFSLESDTQLKSDDAGWRKSLKDLIYPIVLDWASIAIPGGTRQSKLFRTYGISEDKIRISHMTTDTRALRDIRTKPREEFRRELNIAETDVIVEFVARLEWYKGVSVMLDGFEKALKMNSTLLLVVIGDGSMAEQVEEFRKKHPDRVIMTGRQPKDAVVQWMRAGDILAVPSLREQWGMVVNEAMTCGLPVLVSDACGCVDDLLENGRTGLVFPSGDSDALASALATLAADSGLRAELANNAKRLIEPWVIERQAETIRSALAWMSYQK